MALLEARSLSKAYTPGVTAVTDVSLAVDAGEIVCLLGPSGCGKTTLLRMIAGLETPDTGSVWYDGRDISRVPPHQRAFGMMFQDFALFPHKTVRANVAFGLEMRGDSRAQIDARVDEMLELVDLAAFGARDIAQLSGGEQQRVALARALAPRPNLLMLDEPLGALDRALRERLMLELRAILKRVGVTAVYVTHDQTEAFAIADRIAVMNIGHIEQLAPPETVYSRPATPFVARFLGFHNVLKGVVQAHGAIATAVGLLRPAGAREQLVPGTAVALLLKPDAMRVEPAAPHTPAPNEIEAVVTAVSFRGKYFQVWFAAGSQALMFELPAAGGCEIGTAVRLVLDPAGLRVFDVMETAV